MSVDEKPGSPMYVYESTVHCANILLGLNDQRKKDILCDVTLIVERKEFRAHRAVLAACSEYFWQALVGQTKDDLVVSLPEEVQGSGGVVVEVRHALLPRGWPCHPCPRHVTHMWACSIISFCLMHLKPPMHEYKVSVLL